ncbi:hypothetical protein CGCF413_v015588 [Colletotrichum fructicola]|nr:hypothetical protein CFRS1_v015634 [Colletotrichum fructicola]KAF5482693.1 hypothetical protein CGCF413_v015588 [Colletotrichum fructicola]
MSESIRVGLSRSFTSLWAWLPPNSESSLQGLIQSEHRKRESVPQLHLHPLRDCVLDLRISRRVGAPLESQELPRRNELPIFVNAVGNTTVLGAHTLKVPPPDRFRAKASEVIASLREDKLFPYFFDGGQEESFSKLYDTQTVLYNQGFPIEASINIWIDALCIMQGKGGDWHTEASKMASVYGNAILTLCFGDGTDQKLRMPKKPRVHLPLARVYWELSIQARK